MMRSLLRPLPLHRLSLRRLPVRRALRTLLLRLPIMLSAVLVTFVSAQIIWNGTIGRAVPILHWHVKVPLGALPADPAPLTLHDVLDGSWQHGVAHEVAPGTILYRTAVRWKSQIYYSLLGMSAVPDIGVGRFGQLFEWIYVHSYCETPAAALAAEAKVKAAQVRALQRRVEADGHQFLYVLTPSKVAQEPDLLPRGYPCPYGHDAAARHAAWIAAMSAAGVHYVDTVQAVEDAEPKAPICLFSPADSHWNALGAAVAAQAVTRAADSDGARLTPFTFTVGIGNQPTYDERALLELINLVWFSHHFPVPVLHYASTPPHPCVPQRIVEVAGSFIFGINDALEQAACAPEIRLYWYWDRRAYVYPGGHRTQVPLDPARRAEDLLHWADLVVLEENEAQLPYPIHATELATFIAEPLNANAGTPGVDR